MLQKGRLIDFTTKQFRRIDHYEDDNRTHFGGLKHKVFMRRCSMSYLEAIKVNNL